MSQDNSSEFETYNDEIDDVKYHLSLFTPCLFKVQTFYDTKKEIYIY